MKDEASRLVVFEVAVQIGAIVRRLKHFTMIIPFGLTGVVSQPCSPNTMRLYRWVAFPVDFGVSRVERLEIR